MGGLVVGLVFGQIYHTFRIENLELDGCPLKTYLDEVKDLSPEERGLKLAENEMIIAAHNEVINKGWSLF